FAIRQVSQDITGRAKVRLKKGGEANALEIQRAYYDAAEAMVSELGSDPVTDAVLWLWGLTLHAIETNQLDLVADKIDWVTKLVKVIQPYQERHNVGLDHARIEQLDLAYHDIHPKRGLYNILARRGAVARVVSDLDIDDAKDQPPQTTRAKVRGD